MTSRTSYWVGLLLCATTAISASQLIASAQADTLKITGPNGEVKQARQYGPTTPSDTFWSIAQKVRPNDKVTIYQVMSALFDANPHAFSGNNYNTLEKGMILIIPSAEVMAAIPKAQAKLRAERDDRLARTAKPTTKPAVTPRPTVNTDAVKQVQAKPVTPEKPLQITPQQPSQVANNESLNAAKTNQITELNNQLDKANNKTLMLIDELARAQDQLMATRSDNQVLKQKVEELSQIISNLEEDVQLQLEKQQLLVNKNEMLAAELEEANKPPVEQPTDFWRNLTNNTGLLIGAAALPILLLFGIIFLILRRRSSAKDEPKSVSETVSETKTAVSDANDDNDLEDLAVHLDSDDEESIDDLLDLDSLDMQPETELHIDDEQMDMASAMFIEEPETSVEPEAEDDVTSLDDLWAEAMEEQDSELDPLETDEDLDSLLDGLDDNDVAEPSVSSGPEDDLDALLADLDKDLPEDIIDEPQSSASTEQDNIDDLLAGFDMPADDINEPETPVDNPNSQDVDDDDIDSLLTGFDVEDNRDVATESSDKDESIADMAGELESENAVNSAEADEDIDALLASFDVQDTDDMSDSKADDNEDLADAIAAELESDDDLASKDVEAAADDDIDALLASFDVQDADGTPDSTADGNEDLADAIAAELESDDDLASKDVEVDADDDIDALLASFDTSTEAPDSKADDDNEDLADAIAAELESDDDLTSKEVEVDADDDIDALLASFDTPTEAPDITTDDSEDLADAIAAELESDDDLISKAVDVAEDDDLDALLASFDTPTEAPASTADDSEDLADAIAAELESDDDLTSKAVDVAEDDDLDALLASFDASAETDTLEGTADDSADLADAIAAELESDDELTSKADDVTEDDDLDALLASFDAPANSEKVDDDISGLDEVELEPSAIDETVQDRDANKLTPEDAETEVNEVLADNELETDNALESPLSVQSDDVDGLLTSLTADAEDIAEEALDFDEVPENDHRLDSLLADLELASMEDDADDSLQLDTLDDDESDDLSGLIAELEQANEPAASHEELDLNTLESELVKAEDTTDETTRSVGAIDDSMLSDAENELDALLANMGADEVDLPALQDEDAADFDSLSFESDLDSEPVPDVDINKIKGTNVRAEKDSGFFNDLKAAKKSQENILDWETDIFNSATKSSSNDESISNLSTKDDEIDLSEDDLTEFSLSDDYTADDDFVLDDDALTVEQALAALDKEEGHATSPQISEAELTNFERENGFIDINKLLNDADEDDSSVSDNYKDVDVDMGGVESLLGNANMVDVDDEENSVNAKLDLARAYIEIEDQDSAKALLKEVQSDGNSRQQAEANSLLKKLT